jgi:hypothetical protein
MDIYLAPQFSMTETVMENSDIDEEQWTTTTDDLGNFDLSVDSKYLTDTGRIIVKGGVDSFTGQKLTGDLIALKGHTLVTPLTTLLAIATEGPNAIPGLTLAQAEAKFKLALGIDPSLNLSTFDPVAGMSDDNLKASAEQLFKAQQAVFSIMQSSCSLVGGDTSNKILLASKAVTDAILHVADPESALNSGDLSTNLAAITHLSVTQVLDGDPLMTEKVSAISAAIDSVNEAILIHYTGLADTLVAANLGDQEAMLKLAHAKAVAGISQTQLLDAVQLGKTAISVEDISKVSLNVLTEIENVITRKLIEENVDANNKLPTSFRDLIKNNTAVIDATSVTLSIADQASISIDLGVR